MSSGTYQIASVNKLVHVALDPGFRIDLDGMRSLWSDVRQACVERGLRHVLIEAEKPQRLLTADEVLAHGAMVAAGESAPLRVAMCLYDYPSDGLTREFVQHANLGPSSLQIFDELGPALRWLGA